MRLELSRKAQFDLDDIRDFSAERFGVDRAIGYLDAIETAFRRILAFPEIGLVEGTEPPLRSISSGQHRIYYRVRRRSR